MYNGIGLTTPRGSGTNGYVQRNLSFVRKTKEKVKEQTTEDNAVRSYDPELIEHERRRQIEVRCLELRELLEEQEMEEGEIEIQVCKFRAKLMEEKKKLLLRDSSGRPMVKDSHELAVAQEDKNERAKNAFGIRDDFVPGSSLDSKRPLERDVDAEKSGPPRKVTKKETAEDVLEKKNSLAEIKSQKTPSSSSSSSSSDSSSDSSSSDSSTDSSDSSSSSDTSSDESESDRERRRRKQTSSKSKKVSSTKKEKHSTRSSEKSKRNRRSRSRSTSDSPDRRRQKSDRNRR